MKRKIKRKVTIRDVANLINVHHSTVSRALSSDKRDQISFAMIEKVENDIPFILVNRTVDGGDVNAVVVDEDCGIRTVLDHLRSLIHTRIAHIAGPQHTSTGYHRARAVSDYLRTHGMRSDLVETTERFTIEEGERAFRKLLARNIDFTAIVTGNDLLALGCMDVMEEVGLLVPGDISICGYDDILFLERMNPALTTVSLPKYEMGSYAVRALLEIIGGESDRSGVIRLQPRLVIRNSTATASR